jgi:hypothetical protein
MKMEDGTICDRLSPLSNPSAALRADSFPVEGKGFDPLLPSMGRIQEGCNTVRPIFKGSR